MLRIKFFEEFENENPFIVVISDKQGFQIAHSYFKNKKGAFLNDKDITEFSDITPLDVSALYLNEEECRHISELFEILISNEHPGHVYFDTNALGNRIEIIISYLEYEGLF